MSDLLSKTSLSGIVSPLQVGADRSARPGKHRRDGLMLPLAGIGDGCHVRLTRKSDRHRLKQFRRGGEMKNARPVSIPAVGERAEIAANMELPEVRPEWVGADIVTSDGPDPTLIQPSRRLQFPCRATRVVDIGNLSWHLPAAFVGKHHPAPRRGFHAATRNRRGVVDWIEAEGEVVAGHPITVWLPPGRSRMHP